MLTLRGQTKQEIKLGNVVDDAISVTPKLVYLFTKKKQRSIYIYKLEHKERDYLNCSQRTYLAFNFWEEEKTCTIN